MKVSASSPAHSSGGIGDDEIQSSSLIVRRRSLSGPGHRESNMARSIPPQTDRPFSSLLRKEEAEFTGNTLAHLDDTGNRLAFENNVTPTPAKGGHYPYLLADGVTNLMHSGVLIDIKA